MCPTLPAKSVDFWAGFTFDTLDSNRGSHRMPLCRAGWSIGTRNFHPGLRPAALLLFQGAITYFIGSHSFQFFIKKFKSCLIPPPVHSLCFCHFSWEGCLPFWRQWCHRDRHSWDGASAAPHDDDEREEEGQGRRQTENNDTGRLVGLCAVFLINNFQFSQLNLQLRYSDDFCEFVPIDVLRKCGGEEGGKVRRNKRVGMGTRGRRAFSIAKPSKFRGNFYKNNSGEFISAAEIGNSSF